MLRWPIQVRTWLLAAAMIPFALPACAQAGATAAQSVSAGTGHTCAVLNDGAVRCWGGGGSLGYGNSLNVGDATPPSSAGPVNLGAGRTAVQISAGGVSTGSDFRCAVLDNGTVRCWGANEDGQLGLGNTDNIGDDEVPGSVGPVDLGAGRTAIEVQAGGSDGNYHACALLDNGAVRCWGDNIYGQLGLGTTERIGDDETPASVTPVDLGNDCGGPCTATAISTGANHTCAILNDGSVRCWGRNNAGQLGLGNTDNIGDDEAPSAAAPVDLGADATAIDSGLATNCALLESGAVRCWGMAGSGQLGYGNLDVIGDDEAPGSVGPVDLGNDCGGTCTATSVAVGSGHACAVLNDANVRCWGGGGSGVYGGQLGYGNTEAIGNDETPGSAGPVDLGTGRKAAGITAGWYHTCALLDNGTVRCWGENFDGMLGYPNTGTIGDDETPGSVGPVDILPPFAANDSATVTEDAPAAEVPVMGNDSNIDGGTKQIESTSDPAHGTVAIFEGPGLFGTGLTYRPDADYCNSDQATPKDTFTYTLNGGSTATATMTVTCVDDPPSAVADSTTLTEDAPATAIAVLDNDTDIDGGPTSIQAVSDPAHGTASITGGGSGLTYRPDSNFCNSGLTETFTYTLNGGSAASVTVGVTCVDDPPFAASDSATVAANSPSSPVAVLTNDTDVDGGPKTIVSASDPAHGTVTLLSGGLKYQPDPGYCNDGGAKDTFTYTLNGGSTATVSMAVTCPPDTTPPVVRLTKQPKSKVKTTEKKVKVKVAFESEPGADFKCKLDKADYERCTSPWSVKAKSAKGDGKQHKIYVKATDPAGNKGEPAVAKFRVIRKG